MISPDRQIRILLLALVVGVWGLLLRGLFSPISGAAGSMSAEKLIYVVSRDKDKQIFNFDNTPGNIGLTAAGLNEALREAVNKGIRVHSVIPGPNGGYVVFVEK
ncbi:MAG TPA: hypothetical protein VJ302_15775 [Blastocatellia bacterium]|nr:hypothetical protein [Blastocatellia bacterium]